jgi:hypothetical protein
MKNFAKQSIFTLLIITIVGCQSSNLETYQSKEYQFQYPHSYSIIEPTSESPVLVVTGENSRVEIFKDSDFDTDPLGERFHPYSSSGEDIFEAELVPKEKLNSGSYTLWLFYLENDEQSQNDTQAIFESFQIN